MVKNMPKVRPHLNYIDIFYIKTMPFTYLQVQAFCIFRGSLESLPHINICDSTFSLSLYICILAVGIVEAY